MKFVLIVNFQPGVVDTPMDEWKPEEIEAHLDYYRALNRELEESGELIQTEILAGPDLGKIVTSDGDRRAGRDRRPVPGIQGVDRRLPDLRCRIGGSRGRDRGEALGGARTRRARRPNSRSSSARSWRTRPAPPIEMEGYLETARGAVR